MQTNIGGIWVTYDETAISVDEVGMAICKLKDKWQENIPLRATVTATEYKVFVNFCGLQEAYERDAL